jgi:hypothetical protein
LPIIANEVSVLCGSLLLSGLFLAGVVTILALVSSLEVPEHHHLMRAWTWGALALVVSAMYSSSLPGIPMPGWSGAIVSIVGLLLYWLATKAGMMWLRYFGGIVSFTGVMVVAVYA